MLSTEQEPKSLPIRSTIRLVQHNNELPSRTTWYQKSPMQLVVLLDPNEDPDDILRANRSREKEYMFDCAFGEMSNQVRLIGRMAHMQAAKH